MKRNTIDDFWKKVDVRGPDECWEWKQGKHKWGYGQFRYIGKMYRAHRFAWELTNGPIPGSDEFPNTKCVA